MAVKMIYLLAFVLTQQEPAVRTPAIYRCPAAEAESKFFESMVDESGFDSFCVEPAPGPNARQLAAGKVKFVKSSIIDTPANLKWRNATIAFVNGKISPKEWLARTSHLHETVHFLSSPKTPPLRTATGSETGRAVLAELLTTSLPGVPCFTADDIVQTRYLPGPGRYESWILAMNDYLGPMLYMRHEDKVFETEKPEIVEADPKPGLLILRYRTKQEVIQIYMNNGAATTPLPGDLKLDQASINVRLNAEGPRPALNPFGYVIFRLPRGQKAQR